MSLHTDPERPCCATCRRPFQTFGQRWRCQRCGVCIKKRRGPARVTHPLPAEIVARPFSLCCRVEMMRHGGSTWNGRYYAYWKCSCLRTFCLVKPKTTAPAVEFSPRRLDDDGARDLLADIARQLPRYLPPDAREDARQEIALAILEGRRPGRRDVNRIAAEALGMTQNRFRFRSLDAPIPGTERLTWAETLIG